MNILWLTSESTPFAKTGGLADVSGALPKALAQRGHNISVFMPYFRQQIEPKNINFNGRIDMFKVPTQYGCEWASVRILKISPNLVYYFLEYDRFFDRPRLYDWDGKEYEDNADRFIFFCRAAMEFAIFQKMKPDILHANDWHAAMSCVYLKSDFYREHPTYWNCRSVLTIHNIGYQGIFSKEKFELTGLSWDYFNYTCLEYHDCINLLHGGIMTADMVNAVSQTYSSEIQSPQYGFSLETSLQHCASRGKLRGILNGIDDNEWNPQTDKFLPANFSVNDLKGKAICKTALQRHFHLAERTDVPLFSTISRLADQKGLDVFASGLEYLLSHFDYQFVMIGSGEANLENHFRYLAWKYPDKLAIYIGYASNDIAHLTEAGADFFVMPSRYEPCGLNQMYSMRYGTLPIVRHTGGLADSVINFGNENENATGFVFWDLTPMALNNTIVWAADTWKNDHKSIIKMMKNAMNRNFSWNQTASDYERMYQDAHLSV